MQPAAALLHTRHASRDLLLLIAYIYIYKERAMEVLLPNCTASFFSLSLSLSLQPNPMMTTTTTTAATAAAAAAAADIFYILSSLTYYTLTSTAT